MFFGKGFLLLCVVIFMLPFVCTAAENGSGSKDEIVLYAVFPTSGDLVGVSSEGKIALTLAVEALNNFYKDIGSDRTVRLNITDISSDPESALNAVKDLHKSGANMILGQFSSAQLETIKPYADANDVLILSVGSSSTSLSTPGDNILRFNADDSSQATVISQLLRQANISVIIPLVREDYWGNFANLTILDRPMNKITQDEVVRYDPKSQKYDEVIDRLDQLAGSVLANKDKDSIGVLAFTFDDIVQIMEEASKEKYKNLSLVRWFGTDLNTLNPGIIKSPAAAKFGSDRDFTGYILSHNENAGRSVVESISQKLGYDPNGYAYAVYDMGMIGALTEFLHGSNEAKDLKKAVTQLASTYYGTLGPGALNDAGDRIQANYEFWKLKNNLTSGAFWKKIGRLDKFSDLARPAVTWEDYNTTYMPAS